jgi:predicted kinase
MHDLTAIVMVGPPRCGKTTYAKRFIGGNSSIGYISYDNLRDELIALGTLKPTESAIWGAIAQRISDYLGAGLHVLIDGHNSRSNERGILVEHCKRQGAQEVIAIFFNVDYVLCIARNNFSQPKKPLYEIRDAHDRLRQKPPSVAEGFHMVIPAPV